MAVSNLRLNTPPAGLVPQMVQQPQPPAPQIEADNDDGDGVVLKLEHDDGSVTISVDGRSLVPKSEKRNKGDWYANLAEDIESTELTRIAEDLMQGIGDDLESRQQWIEDRAQGIQLLGLKVDLPNTQDGSADGAPVEGMSKVRHPLLQEAVIRFQANAQAEMLPTDGPVKVRDDGLNGTPMRDRLADALQKDMNHFLTTTATEYYPDTDRMHLMLGFGGTSFKKVYFCPLRNRPVSESVDADDLIVNNTATDLQNARRITHRLFMRPSTIKRMQLLDVYRDIDLSDPTPTQLDAVQDAKANQQGINMSSNRPGDRDREVYEVYCELDIVGYEHKWKGKVSGLEVPYRVTIDKSTREVLSVVRNYAPPVDGEEERLPVAKVCFVKYTFVPGMGFYDLGLLNLLGNTTNAATAIWRELLDAGMFASFPGFLYSKQAGRQNSNVFRVPPGGGAPIDTGGQPINQAVMPLPYKEPSPALMQLSQDIVTTGQRVGGISEVMVGEGRADAPVGTTLAMIEQAIKVVNSVHKRMHAAQSQEFKLLQECFREHPESFWQFNDKPSLPWSQDLFLAALSDHELVPRADPNTSSHTQRIMKVMGLKQLQGANPNLYDEEAVDRLALQTLGWSNPDQFFKPKEDREQMPPEIMKGMEELKIAHQEADAKTMTAQAAMAKAQMGPAQQGGVVPQGMDPMEAQLKAGELEIKKAELAQKGEDMQLRMQQMTMQNQRAAMQDENRDKDRVAEVVRSQMQLEKEREDDAREMDHHARMEQAGQAHEMALAQQKMDHDHHMRGIDHVEHAEKLEQELDIAKKQIDAAAKSKPKKD